MSPSQTGTHESDPDRAQKSHQEAPKAELSPLACLDQAEAEAGPPALERWNYPKENRNRYLATVLGLVVMGLNDACLGALIPYIEQYYAIGYTLVSLLFLTSFVGYMAAALSSNLFHHHFGQRGIAVIAPLSRLVGYTIVALHPRYALLPVAMLFPGFGNGLEDSAWNAFVGGLQDANQLLGFLHGAYGAAATVAPLVATAMVTKASPALPWYTYYYLMIAVSVFEACFTIIAFWAADAASYRRKHASQQTAQDGARTTTRTVLREPITWVLAFFLLGYVGAEVSLGGWITSFMLTVRKAEPFLAGLTVTLFWLGLTVGRVALGFVTGRIGEKLAIAVYLLLAIALQLLYWLVPSLVASMIFAFCVGMAIGPLFPSAIVAATKLLPPDYHVSAIGFAAAFGGGGAAIFPFVVGAIAQAKGVEALQPIVVATLVFISLLWLSLPGGLKRGGLEQARDRREPVGHEFRRLYGWLKFAALMRHTGLARPAGARASQIATGKPQVENPSSQPEAQTSSLVEKPGPSSHPTHAY